MPATRRCALELVRMRAPRARRRRARGPLDPVQAVHLPRRGRGGRIGGRGKGLGGLVLRRPAMARQRGVKGGVGGGSVSAVLRRCQRDPVGVSPAGGGGG